MFCSKFKYEYVEGIKVCPSCDVELIEKLPEMQSGPVEVEYIELVTFFETMDLGLVAILYDIIDKKSKIKNCKRNQGNIVNSHPRY